MRPPLPDATERFVSDAPLHRGAIVDRVYGAAARLDPGSRVLDAGAGDAPYRPLFAHCEYRTQDWPSSVHDGARSADVVADLRDLPLDDASFDFVLCTEVLEHVSDPLRALQEIRRVLRPGGSVLITVPFVIELHEEPHDFFRYTPHALRHLLVEAGFDQIVVEPLTGWAGTLSHVLRHAAPAMRPALEPPRTGTRVAGLILRQFGKALESIAPRLDRRLDQRRAFPIGWACTAEAATAPARSGP